MGGIFFNKVSEKPCGCTHQACGTSTHCDWYQTEQTDTSDLQVYVHWCWTSQLYYKWQGCFWQSKHLPLCYASNWEI